MCLVGYVCVFLSGAGCVGRRCYCLQANWSCTCEAGPFWSQADSGEATGLHQQRNVCCGCCVASAPSGWVCRIWPLHQTRLRSRVLRTRFGDHGEPLVNSQSMFMLQSISGWLAKMAKGKWRAIIASSKLMVYMHHGQTRPEAGSPSAVAYHYLPLAVMSRHWPFPIMAILSEINCMWSSVCERMRSGLMVSLWLKFAAYGHVMWSSVCDSSVLSTWTHSLCSFSLLFSPASSTVQCCVCITTL